jgi:AraC-like DNA-binding protein
MLILRQMPDPRRLRPIPANESFRRAFYSRWGREAAIVCAPVRAIEYPPFTQRLSIKTARGGCERYFLAGSGRMLAVDDDNFLVLNDGRTYSSSVESDRDIESYTIFFAPGAAEEMVSALSRPLPRALEGNAPAGRIEFAECLQPHNRLVTPVLRRIRRRLDEGNDDEAWYEEQLLLLLERMVANQRRMAGRANDIRALKRSTRAEIHRRILLATDYIHANFDKDIALDVLAQIACLSKYHFLRSFTAIHGITPNAFIHRKRTRVAGRLLASSALTMDEVAQRVGYAARSSLFRQLRRQPPGNHRGDNHELEEHRHRHVRSLDRRTGRRAVGEQ